MGFVDSCPHPTVLAGLGQVRGRGELRRPDTVLRSRYKLFQKDRSVVAVSTVVPRRRDLGVLERHIRSLSSPLLVAAPVQHSYPEPDAAAIAVAEHRAEPLSDHVAHSVLGEVGQVRGKRELHRVDDVLRPR